MEIKFATPSFSPQSPSFATAKNQFSFKSSNLIIENGLNEIIKSELLGINSQKIPGRLLKKIVKQGSLSDIDFSKVCNELQQAFPKLTKKLEGGVFNLSLDLPFSPSAIEKQEIITKSPWISQILGRLTVSYERGNKFFKAPETLHAIDLLPQNGSYKKAVKKIVNQIKSVNNGEF